MDITNQIMNILPALDQEQRDKFKNDLAIVLHEYDIQIKKTDLMIIDSDNTEKAIRMFFIAKKVEGCTDKTISYYKGTLDRFFRIVPRNLGEINTDLIRYYLAIRSSRDHLSKTSQDNELRVLKSFFRWCCGEDYINKNPTDAVKAIKKEKRIKKAIPEKEFEKLRENAKNKRDKAIIDVLYSTGVRVSELVGINKSDIEGDEIIVFGKGEKERKVYLNARAQLSLQEYLDERKDSEDPLFVSSRKPYQRMSAGAVETMLRTLGKNTGIAKIHPHRFRRTMASNALNRGMPIEEVQQLLGHSDIETTTIYARSTNENIKTDHRKYVV